MRTSVKDVGTRAARWSAGGSKIPPEKGGTAQQGSPARLATPGMPARLGGQAIVGANIIPRSSAEGAEPQRSPPTR
jgi:hypothetical protein